MVINDVMRLTSRSSKGYWHWDVHPLLHYMNVMEGNNEERYPCDY